MNRRSGSTRFGWLGLAVLLLGSVASSQAQTFSVTDLGPQFVGSGNLSVSINNQGQIAGSGTASGGGWHAFLYSSGTGTDLGTLPGGSTSFGNGINDSGQVVGYAYTSSNTWHAFLYSSRSMTDLGTLPGGTNSGAQSINSSGQAVGYAYLSSTIWHAVSFNGGTVTDLGTLSGGQNSQAFGINSSGQIVGSSYTGGGPIHAFLYSGGVMTDLGTLPGGSNSFANAINDSGQVVGYAYTSASLWHAFLYSGGSMTDLGTLAGGTSSEAKGINKSGQIVGRSAISGGTYHAFLYSGGTMIDLNTAITPPSGVYLVSASAINDSGQIVATGSDGHIYLLTPPPPALSFVPITPCRVADTRNATGPFGGPTITGGSTRSFTLPSGACGIPSTAQAYSLNAAMVPTGGGWITLWGAGQSQPLAASVNSPDGRVKSNGAIVPAGTSGAISVYASVTTDVVLDVNGYFVPASTNPTALAFYPVTPCRIADTRNATGSLGGPYMSGGSTRTFPVLAAAACNIPSSAQAFSLNLAVVPLTATLGWLTAWPTGQSQPLVASLNDPPGVVLSNGAIVPAPTDQSGQINIYATHDTHVIIDINGYFAPPGLGGLYLYPVRPCRVLDTRYPSGSSPFTGTLAVDVVDSGCGAPGTAKDYVFNATVVPQTGSSGYLTMWPQGMSMPLAANLNSSDGAITGNMALVPTSSGWINAYFSGSTYLILDLFGYFAQ